ncbi:energy transducer TonB [Endozoicomonas arenosclerae]|uniref:energy transducer TonB n=1 Tax=Endozoicomonas arenosclerae TaxID=1633495 RepID=UPI000AE1FF7C|nr:energy transducer TonB [Endozoicomonas arenosclerae]
MSRTLLFTLIISVAAHVAVAMFNAQEESQQQKLAMGSIKAPISMSFSSVQQAAPQPEPEPVKETPKPVEKKPEPVKKPEPKKDVVKIAEPEPKPEVKKEPEPKPEKIVQKEPEPEQPKKEIEPQQEPPAENQVAQTATQETEVEGVSNEPVFVSQPAIRKSAPPRYPRIAQRRNQQGVVMLEVVVDTEGHAINIKVLESSGFAILDKSAIASVEDWEFEPQKRNNQLVASRVHIPVAFQLN